MKKSFIISAGILLLIGLTISACKKNDTGGKATIMADIKHHDTPIKGATLYIKYGADELPSNPTSNYDEKIVGSPKEAHIHVENLRYGKYYLYSEGYDSTIMSPVKGGIAVKIKWSDRKEEIEVTVPVTE